jgi:hypothetical protein
MNIQRRLQFVLLGALVCGGCASTPEASVVDDAAAKRFEPALNASIIYLYRADGPSNGVATVWVDGRLIGQSLPTTYFRAVTRPGLHSVTASGPDVGKLQIETREDGVYFVAMNVLGEYEGSSTTVFRSVAPETGKAAILKCCTLLESWRPGQWRLNF